MKILVLHDQIGQDHGPEDQDNLVQVAHVRQALRELGCAVQARPIRPDRLAGEDFGLVPGRYDSAVFNLVEGAAGAADSAWLVPARLEELCIPFTGAGSGPMRLSTDKIEAKKILAENNLPFPGLSLDRPGPVLVKSVSEHASLGLDQGSVLDLSGPGDQSGLEALIRSKREKFGGQWFAEDYIHGREFNLALIQYGDRVELLPQAEIRFHGFQDTDPRIVDFRAKWVEDSKEYQGTARTFAFPEQDRELLARLGELAKRCFDAFGLCGYARVDFRVDEAGRPFIIDVNANPCLSPDAGFAAALAEQGIEFPRAVARIIEAGFDRWRNKEARRAQR